MKELNLEKFKRLNQMFTHSFYDAYKKINKDDKDEIFYYFDNIYRIWYYSAIIQNGFATPSIFADMWFNKTKDNITVCVPKVMGSDFVFKWHNYSVDNHPFFKDLFALVDVVDENAAFDELTLGLVQRDFDKFSEYFTITDNTYISYLVEVALEMKIIREIPSIYIAKFQPTAKGRNLSQLSCRKALEIIIECCAKICCKKFTTIFGNHPELNKNLVYDWLKTTDLTDNVYADLYDLVNVDILDLWKSDFSKDVELDDVDRAALAAVYPVGRMIDKYFLTPFGRYLQIIQPIYYNPFDFDRELGYLYQNNLKNELDNMPAVFCPSSLYRLTTIGNDLLKCYKEERPFVLNEMELEMCLAKILEKYSKVFKDKY